MSVRGMTRMVRMVAGVLAGSLCGDAVGVERPNVVIIYADDLGWGDLGCYGAPAIRTPQLDRMAAEGMRFTDFYSAAEVCTPSRAALLTGRYAVRSGMSHDRYRVLRANASGGLPKEEETLAEVLKGVGYATGMVGKWHLGHLAEHLPGKHGFDWYFGMPFSNDMMPAAGAPAGRDKFFREDVALWETPLLRGEAVLEAKPDQRQLTKRYTEEAVAFIRERKAGPFFLYMAHTFPHVPLFASEAFRGRSPGGIYGDVVEELDWSVGRVLEVLREERLAERTLVFFSSDNGPWTVFGSHGGSAGPLRDGKGSTWEGGMRVPGIAWWPGKIAAGVVQREVALTMDLVPTCAKLAGAAMPERALDGVDLAPLLFGGGMVERDVFLYYRGTEVYAARLGKWKAHFRSRSGYGTDAVVVHDPPLLFHLGEDPGERWDRAGEQPEVVKKIREAVAKKTAAVTVGVSQLEATVR